MTDLSTALKEAYTRAKTSTRHLIAVELLHSTFPNQGAIRYVNYDDNISVSGEAYTGVAMAVLEPEIGTEPDNQVEVSIDTVAGIIQFYINEAVRSPTPIVNVNLRPFGFNTTTKSVIDVVGVYPFKILKVRYSMTAAVLTLGHVSPTNKPFPGVKYTPSTHPDLYR